MQYNVKSYLVNGGPGEGENWDGTIQFEVFEFTLVIFLRSLSSSYVSLHKSMNVHKYIELGRRWLRWLHPNIDINASIAQRILPISKSFAASDNKSNDGNSTSGDTFSGTAYRSFAF